MLIQSNFHSLFLLMMIFPLTLANQGPVKRRNKLSARRTPRPRLWSAIPPELRSSSTGLLLGSSQPTTARFILLFQSHAGPLSASGPFCVGRSHSLCVCLCLWPCLCVAQTLGVVLYGSCWLSVWFSLAPCVAPCGSSEGSLQVRSDDDEHNASHGVGQMGLPKEP